MATRRPKPGHRQDLTVTFGLHLRIRQSLVVPSANQNASVGMLQLPSEFRVRTANFQFKEWSIGKSDRMQRPSR